MENISTELRKMNFQYVCESQTVLYVEQHNITHKEGGVCKSAKNWHSTLTHPPLKAHTSSHSFLTLEAALARNRIIKHKSNQNKAKSIILHRISSFIQFIAPF